MATADQRSLLYLKLDEIQGSQVVDVSGIVATLSGNAEIVADNTFGACMRLDQNVLVQVPNLPLDGTNPPHTLAAWVWMDAYPQARNVGREWILLLGQDSEYSHHWLINADGSTQIGVWGNLQVKPRLPLGTWTHIAVTYDGTQLICYLDGQPFDAPLQCTFRLSNTNLSLGKGYGFEPGMTGRMACVRAFGRALTQAEVQQVRLADQSPAAAFQRSFPINFRLFDDDDQPVLYITDLPSGVDTNLAISNTSPQAIALVAPSSPQASPDNHHFELRYRPGILSNAARQQLAVAGGGWSVAFAEQPDHTVSVYLLSSTAQTIQPSSQLGLTLNHMSADGVGGARGTRVEFRYQQLCPVDDTTTITGSRIQYLSIVNHRGQQYVPLHAGLAGINSVLNDGSPNTLFLRLTDTSPTNTLDLAPGTATAPSRFTISFDVTPDDTDWALANAETVRPIDVAQDPSSQSTAVLVGGRGTQPQMIACDVVRNDQGDAPVWTLTLQQAVSLPPGAYVQIQLGNIVTTYGDGQTNVYVGYANIPGYWDGQLIALIEKTPIRVRQANDYQKAQFTMSGGGTVTWGGPGQKLKWTQRFIAISAERPQTFRDGYVDITMPSGTISGQNVYNGRDREAGPDGVVLYAWDALYAVHTTGGGYTQVSFQITNYTQLSFFAPSNWLLVAVVNGDDGSIKLGTGLTLAKNSTSTRGSPMPSGAILMWSGSSNNIPDGWVLCDGQNGTPNLSDRFIIGASSTNQPGATGGSASVQLSIDQMPSHAHSGAAGGGGHRHVIPVDQGPGEGLGWTSPNAIRASTSYFDNSGNPGTWAVIDTWAYTKSGEGDHQHGVTIDAAGSGQAHENRPPYYALCFIMKL